MSIIDRIQRIAKAGIHSALDKAESPGGMLKQSIREMEDSVKEAKEAAAQYAITLKKAEREHEQLKRLAAEWQHKAEQAVRGGQDDLARRALTERHSADERAKALEPSIAERAARYQELKTSMADLQMRLDEAKTRLADLEMRKQAANARATFETSLGSAAARGAGSDFEKFESQVLHAEAKADIESDLRGSPADAGRELDAKTRALSVDAELDALKKSLGGRE
jgi:phage shock protein A